MERKMRRFKQLLTEQSTKEILENATNGVLSLVDSDGEPYGVHVVADHDEINIDCMTGKEAIELVRKHKESEQ